MQPMDDLAKAQAYAQQALDEVLALQARQQPGDVSIELVVALAKATYALDGVILAQRAGSLRIKPSLFDQEVDLESTTWATPDHPRGGADSLH